MAINDIINLYSETGGIKNVCCYGRNGESKSPVKIFDSIYRIINFIAGGIVQTISDLSNRHRLF